MGRSGRAAFVGDLLGGLLLIVTYKSGQIPLGRIRAITTSPSGALVHIVKKLSFLEGFYFYLSENHGNLQILLKKTLLLSSRKLSQ